MRRSFHFGLALLFGKCAHTGINLLALVFKLQSNSNPQTLMNTTEVSFQAGSTFPEDGGEDEVEFVRFAIEGPRLLCQLWFGSGCHSQEKLGFVRLLGT